ncbi:uncharacterized protein [Apostichopus japonicus]|uniref:uncharacterized protein n=1 Tax=Stichopus japonicus TaxID=307972 RepID=UPI003AB14534
MHCYKFIAVLAYLCFDSVFGRTQTPWLFEDDVTPTIVGFFPISHEAIVGEIKQRTAQDDVCGNAFQEKLLKWEKGNTETSLMILIRTNTGKDDTKSYSVYFTIHRDDFDLGLVFFTTDKDVNESSVHYVVDDITVTKATVTVTKGEDRLTIMFDWLKGKKARPYTSDDFFHSWYPYDFSGSWERYCAIQSGNGASCPGLESYLCEKEKAHGDVCFAGKFEGLSTDISVKVTEMTGIFRERSLVTVDPPFKSREGYFFEGIRHLGFAFSCLYDI